jgi:site-specific DNA recombinase
MTAKRNVSSHSKPKVIGYTRVSTSKQKKDGSSHEVQKQLILKFAEDTLGLSEEDVNIFTETHSASKINYKPELDVLTDRPILQRIIDMARLREFDKLICYSHDRLSRNFAEFLALKALFLKYDVEILFTKPGEIIKGDNGMLDRFFELMLSNMAQLEAQVIGHRVKLGTKNNVEHGFSAGGPVALGYTLEYPKLTKKNKLVRTTQATAVSEVFDLYKSGYTYEQIAKIMQEKYSKTIQRKWSKGTVSSILNNEGYTGFMLWNRKCSLITGSGDDVVRLKMENLKIIEPADFDLVSEIKSKQNSPQNARFLSTPYLLKNKLVCGSCGNYLKAKNYGKNKTNIYYCKCDSTLQYWTLKIPQEAIDKMVLEVVIKAVENSLTSAVLDNAYETYCTLIDNEQENANTMRQTLKAEIENNKVILEKALDVILSKSHLQAPEDDRKIYTEDFFALMTNFYMDTKLKLDQNISDEKKYGDILKRTKLTKTDFSLFLSKSLNIMTNNYNSCKNSGDEKARRRTRRIFIDQVLDKVIVNSSSYGETLSIYLKIPEQLGNFTVSLPESSPINSLS